MCFLLARIVFEDIVFLKIFGLIWYRCIYVFFFCLINVWPISIQCLSFWEDTWTSERLLYSGSPTFFLEVFGFRKTSYAS